MTPECGPDPYEDERVKKQKLILHAFERAAKLSSQQPENSDQAKYIKTWSHRLESLAELGVENLIKSEGAR